MEDCISGKHVEVNHDDSGRPYIFVSLPQLNHVRSLFDKHNINYFIKRAIQEGETNSYVSLSLDPSSNVTITQSVLDAH
jgi:hypothetical protein